MADLRLASRRSALALAQADIVATELSNLGLGSSVVAVDTTGDIDRHTPVSVLTEVGAFVRAVQQAVLEGRADIAVHSGKDLPVVGPPRLHGRHPARGPAGDVLCGGSLDGLREGARVGTGSPRRGAQLRRLRPDVEIVDIRGNVQTRLGRIRGGEVDGVVLAEAGLTRLGLEHEITHRFSLDEMVPAPAQAALTAEAIVGSEADTALAGIEHHPTRLAVEAERRLLALTGAGCRSALGAYATVGDTGGIVMEGFVEDERGPRRACVQGDTPFETAGLLRKELGL